MTLFFFLLFSFGVFMFIFFYCFVCTCSLFVCVDGCVCVWVSVCACRRVCDIPPCSQNLRSFISSFYLFFFCSSVSVNGWDWLVLRLLLQCFRDFLLTQGFFCFVFLRILFFRLFDEGRGWKNFFFIFSLLFFSALFLCWVVLSQDLQPPLFKRDALYQ